ncbi:MAG: hypothetical protein R2939_02375 [Kofleriaceae bacterium]
MDDRADVGQGVAPRARRLELGADRGHAERGLGAGGVARQHDDLVAARASAATRLGPTKPVAPVTTTFIRWW